MTLFIFYAQWRCCASENLKRLVTMLTYWRDLKNKFERSKNLDFTWISPSTTISSCGWNASITRSAFCRNFRICTICTKCAHNVHNMHNIHNMCAQCAQCSQYASHHPPNKTHSHIWLLQKHKMFVLSFSHVVLTRVCLNMDMSAIDDCDQRGAL